ncbi:MAG: protein-tyrosine-phosphatase [Crocinitomicaceae bacterium]|jgi:arsenate reductase|nr:protein-tyrosine-phosphatase [Crocinitomicaceae bacterium]
MNPTIQKFIQSLSFESILPNRMDELNVLVAYIQKKLDVGQPVILNYICTHNSRRSQFSQLWSQVNAAYFSIPVQSLSGGVEVTEFNSRAIESLKRFGFEITASDEDNPRYEIGWGQELPMIMFSKLYDDEVNQSDAFAAVMTCSHADENCPIVHGCDQRISLRYEDPKVFDNTPLEGEKYDERSTQIATELKYVFSKINR